MIPEIETARLRMRPLRLDDLDAIHGIWVDPGVRKYLWDDEVIPRGTAESVLVQSTERFESRGFGIWAMIHRERGALIGFCGFWQFDGEHGFEILYGLARPYWGMGLATEAARAAIRYGFEAGLDRVVASADTENAASLRVMQKAGMGYEKRVLRGGRDQTYYALSREAYEPDDAPYALRRR